MENQQLSETKPTRECKELSLAEIKKLETMYALEELTLEQKLALRCFLFSAYTGVRYRDLRMVSFTGIEQNPFFRTKYANPGKPMHTKLRARALALFGKNMTVPGYPLFADTTTKHELNGYLHEVAILAGIKVDLTIRLARIMFQFLSVICMMSDEEISRNFSHTN